MNYEKKYNEVLEKAKKIFSSKRSVLVKKQTLESIFPELKEKEDERIRKSILTGLIDCRDAPDLGWSNFGGIPIDVCIAWLEKQGDKEEPQVYETGNGEVITYSESEGYKVDEEDDDFIIYHPLKNGKGEYECIPYSFYGSLTSFSEDKDLIDFLRTCFYTKEECNEWIEQQKEPHYTKCNALFDKCVENCDKDVMKKVSDEIDAQLQKEQKPAEWSENIIRKAIKEVGLTQHQIDWFKTNVFPPKQEWSEEDEEMVSSIQQWLDENEQQYVKKEKTWLKSLKERLKTN